MPGLGLSVPFTIDTSGSVLDLWEEEKRPRSLWRSIKQWRGWGKEKVEHGLGQPLMGGEQQRGEPGVQAVDGVQVGLPPHSCQHGQQGQLGKQGQQGQHGQQGQQSKQGQQCQHGQHDQNGQYGQHGQRSGMLSSKLKDPNNIQVRGTL